MPDTCTNCGKYKDQVPKNQGVWWTLSNYYNIWGYFCPKCYNLVSHNSTGDPLHCKEYRTIYVKQQLQQLQHSNKGELI